MCEEVSLEAPPEEIKIKLVIPHTSPLGLAQDLSIAYGLNEVICGEADRREDTCCVEESIKVGDISIPFVVEE